LSAVGGRHAIQTLLMNKFLLFISTNKQSKQINIKKNLFFASDKLQM